MPPPSSPAENEDDASAEQSPEEKGDDAPRLSPHPADSDIIRAEVEALSAYLDRPDKDDRSS